MTRDWSLANHLGLRVRLGIEEGDALPWSIASNILWRDSSSPMLMVSGLASPPNSKWSRFKGRPSGASGGTVSVKAWNRGSRQVIPAGR
jgi:hypothetical protein